MPEESNYQGLQFYVATKNLKTNPERVVITQNINLMKPSKTGQNPEPIIVQFSEILKQINLEIAIAKTSHNGKCTERYYQDDLRIGLIVLLYCIRFIYVYNYVYIYLYTYFLCICKYLSIKETMKIKAETPISGCHFCSNKENLSLENS